MNWPKWRLSFKIFQLFVEETAPPTPAPSTRFLWGRPYRNPSCRWALLSTMEPLSSRARTWTRAVGARGRYASQRRCSLRPYYIALTNSVIHGLWKVPHRVRKRSQSLVLSISLFPCVPSCLTLCNPPCSSVKGIFSGKNTGVDCCFLFQGILPTQGSDPSLLCPLHWHTDSLPLRHLGSPSPPTYVHLYFHSSLAYGLGCRWHRCDQRTVDSAFSQEDSGPGSRVSRWGTAAGSPGIIWCLQGPQGMTVWSEFYTETSWYKGKSCETHTVTLE